MRKQVILVLLENKAGALARVTSLFAQRAYNIDSLSVAPTHDNSLSRMTITTHGTDQQIEQIEKNLHKLIDVIKVDSLPDSSEQSYAMMLVKIKSSGSERQEIMWVSQTFNIPVIELERDLITFCLSGSATSVSKNLERLQGFDILETAASGLVSMHSGNKKL